MSITTKQAYLCSHCDEIFWTPRGAENCVARHKVSAEAARLLAAEKTKKENKKHSFRNSITSFDQASAFLISLAEEQGHTLDCKIHGKIRECSVSHSSPMDFNAKDTYCSDLGSRYGSERKNYNRRLAFVGNIKGKFSSYKSESGKQNRKIYFSDWLRQNVKGFNTGSGGGGDGFEYQITLWVSDFPNIKEQYDFMFPFEKAKDLHLELERKESEMYKEKSRLTREYEDHFLPLKLIADPDWLYYDGEARDFKAEAQLLIEKAEDMTKKANLRKAELDDERGEQTTPSVDFDFDFELLDKLSNIFGTRIRWDK